MRSSAFFLVLTAAALSVSGCDQFVPQSVDSTPVEFNADHEPAVDRQVTRPVVEPELPPLRDDELPPDVDVASLRLLKDLADAWSGKPAETQPETSSLLEGQ